jgi:hypothetical protein
MRRLSVVLLLGAVLSLGCGWAGPPVYLGGAASKQTEPFHLEPGAYRLDWSVSTAPCLVTLRLHDAHNRNVSQGLYSGQVLVTAPNTAYAYVQTAGDYYLDVFASSCQWFIRLDAA